MMYINLITGKDKMSIRFQMYIPDETNEKIEWLRFKEKTSKNKIILKALDQYLKKVMKKYPEFKQAKEE